MAYPLKKFSPALIVKNSICTCRGEETTGHRRKEKALGGIREEAPGHDAGDEGPGEQERPELHHSEEGSSCECLEEKNLREKDRNCRKKNAFRKMLRTNFPRVQFSAEFLQRIP